MGPVLTFVGAVFFGTAATASLGYVIAVNVARLAILSLVSKKLTPKIDLSQISQDKMLTIKSAIQPQAFVYGQDMLSGPLIYAQIIGGSRDTLSRVVALTGREIESFEAYRFDDDDLAVPGTVPAAGGTVLNGRFADVVDVDFKLGTATQTVIAALNTADPTLWTSAHTGRGWSLLYTEMRVVGNNDTFDEGIPQNLRALVKGHKVYDPRKDSTQTTIPGSGAHRVNDETTWEWSNNPALCLADWLMWSQVGLTEDPARIDWDLVAAAADICEEQVQVPPVGAPVNQNRYTCNFTFYANQDRGQVKKILEDAMLGWSVFSQGKWRMWAGAAQTASIDLDEANLAGGIFEDVSTSFKDRYNRVRGKFVDPSRNYVASEYPEQRVASYVTQDANQVKYQTFDQNACNNSYEAQRNAIHVLRQSRQQIVCKFEGNWSCLQVQAGTVVTVTNAELGWTSKKFLCTAWSLNKDATGVDLTLVEENDSVWTDPDVTDYTVRDPTGDLTPPGQAEVQLTNATIHNVGITPVYSGVKLEAAGRVKYANAANVYSENGVPVGDWLGTGQDSYFVKATLISGTINAGTFGSWLPLTVDRFWDVLDDDAVVKLELAADTVTPVVLTTGTFTLSTESGAPGGLGFYLIDVGDVLQTEDAGWSAQNIDKPAYSVGDLLVVAQMGQGGQEDPVNSEDWTEVAIGDSGMSLHYRTATGDANDEFEFPAGSGGTNNIQMASFVQPAAGVDSVQLCRSYASGATIGMPYNAGSVFDTTPGTLLITLCKKTWNAPIPSTATPVEPDNGAVVGAGANSLDTAYPRYVLFGWFWEYEETQSAVAAGDWDITGDDTAAGSRTCEGVRFIPN